MMPCSVSGSGSSSVEPCSDVELDELLGVQRVAARSLEQGLLGLGCERRAAEQAPDQLRGLLVGER